MDRSIRCTRGMSRSFVRLVSLVPESDRRSAYADRHDELKHRASELAESQSYWRRPAGFFFLGIPRCGSDTGWGRRIRCGVRRGRSVRESRHNKGECGWRVLVHLQSAVASIIDLCTGHITNAEPDEHVSVARCARILLDVLAG